MLILLLTMIIPNPSPPTKDMTITTNIKMKKNTLALEESEATHQEHWRNYD